MRMELFLCLVVVLAGVTHSQADRFLLACPTLNVIDPFAISNFTGTWYKQYGMNTPWEMGSCIKTTYNVDNDTEAISFTNSLKSIFGGKEKYSGTAVFANSTSSEGKLIVTSAHPFFGTIAGEVWVVASDYANYAIVYSCHDVFDMAIESAWVLSRQQVLTLDSAQLIASAVSKFADQGGPSLRHMKPVSHKRC